MAFTVFTVEDRTPQGTTFADSDSLVVKESGVLKVRSKDYGTRIYAPGFWQLVTYEGHPEHLRQVD